MSIQIISVSPEGKMQLPDVILKEMFLAGGGQLAAIAEGDGILLKPLRTPGKEDFFSWMKEMQSWAKEVGYREEDVDRIIKEVRNQA